MVSCECSRWYDDEIRWQTFGEHRQWTLIITAWMGFSLKMLSICTQSVALTGLRLKTLYTARNETVFENINLPSEVWIYKKMSMYYEKYYFTGQCRHREEWWCHIRIQWPNAKNVILSENKRTVTRYPQENKFAYWEVYYCISKHT